MMLEEFDYSLEHTRGSTNGIADSLSRLFVVTVPPKPSITYTNMLTNEIFNSNLGFVFSLFKNDKSETNDKLSIAEENAPKVLTTLHNILVHPGRTKFYETIKNVIKVKNIKNLIRRITDSCIICNTSKENSVKYGKISGGLLSENNFEFISIDILGPIKTKHFSTEHLANYFYIIVICDMASRWTEIDIVFNIRSEQVIKTIKEQFIGKHGTPK
jgi:hypothetical protein